MLVGRVVYLLLLRQVATVPISPTEGSDAHIAKGRYEPGVHTINNANPYQGVTVTEGHGKYTVIFEPLQNVQTSRSTYKLLLLSTSLPIWNISNTLKSTWRLLSPP